MNAKRLSMGPRFSLSAGALLVAGALPAAGLGAPAARVEFAIGDVQVLAPGGQVRPARKGAEVNAGETVSTNVGRAQLRFSDGAYVSLQPQSEFRIDDYRFDSKADGSERGVFSLLKGGLRTITGLVGRTNKRNYQVNTAVATIGIRGTEYTIAYTNSISGSVGEGEIEVCTTRCVPFGSGESFFVPNAETLPQLTNKKTDLPPAQPDENAPALIAGNETNPDGTPAGLILAGKQELDGIYVAGFASNYFQPGTVVFDANGVVTDLDGIIPAGSVVQTGNDGFMAWGYFPKQASASPEMLVFATGLPVSNLSELSIGNKVATYDLADRGATPVLNPNTGLTIGTLTSATMAVDFGVGSATANLAWTIQGSPYVAGLNGSFDGPIYLNGSCSVGSCSVNGLAQVFGPNAVRAGITYGFSSGNTNGIGAAALVQTGLTDSTQQTRSVVSISP